MTRRLAANGRPRARAGRRGAPEEYACLMPDWAAWAIAAAVLAAGEAATATLVLGPLALAAAVAAIVAAAGAGVAIQAAAFVLASVAALGVLRPIARSH